MIEAKDLRIGNHINSTRSTCLFAKGEIKIDKRDLITILRYGAEFLEPIPLTEGWWTKFGYESFKEFINCLHEHSKIPLADENLDFWVKKLEGFAVHEIQNLYSSLTGGLELTIKEL